MTHTAKILTVSESASRGEREDRSGDELARALASHGFRILDRRVVPDGMASVSGALLELSTGFAGLVVTTGGTGFSPTDVTPEATRAVIEREAPGLAEAMRSVSPLGRLSRGVAGSVGSCLILNVPGSPGGAVESLEAVADVLRHALELLAGRPTPLIRRCSVPGDEMNQGGGPGTTSAKALVGGDLLSPVRRPGKGRQ